MFKKTIKYTNFNGEEKERDCYFNLTESECAELEASEDNSLSKKIEIIAKDTEDKGETVRIFKEIILKAYGERSADGESFMKSPEIRNRFECSAAYNTLFMELATDADKMSEFIKKVIPQVDTKQADGTAAFKSVAN